MDHEGSGVEFAVRAAINDLSFVVGQDKIGDLGEREGKTEGVDPESCRINGMTNDEMTGNISSQPCLPKIRKAAARRPLSYMRSFNLLSKVGGPQRLILTLALSRLAA